MTMTTLQTELDYQNSVFELGKKAGTESQITKLLKNSKPSARLHFYATARSSGVFQRHLSLAP